eukprot:4428558-Prymnesium_polylepis.1
MHLSAASCRPSQRAPSAELRSTSSAAASSAQRDSSSESTAGGATVGSGRGRAGERALRRG